MSGAKWIRNCCIITALVVIITAVTLVILYFTVFKLKQPEVVAHPVGLTHIAIGVFPVFKLNVTISLLISIKNDNYGGFKYKNTTAYVNYRGVVVAEAPIAGDLISAHSNHNITADIDILGDVLLSVPHLKDDFDAGVLNLTSVTVLHGKAILLNVIKLKAVANTKCDISIFTKNLTICSQCSSKLKL